jgi:hypothetical protein
MRIPALLIAFVVALSTLHAEPATDMAADFAWFGKLGFADVKEMKFVRYSYGSLTDSDGKQEELWSNGFLLDETPEKFRILTFEFDPLEFSKANQASKSLYRFVSADLRGFVEAELHPADPRVAPFSRHRFLRGPEFTDRTQLFVLAWMCGRQGLDDLAARLYEAAQAAGGLHLYATPDDHGWPFRHQLDRDLGHFEMWRTIVAFSDPKVSRRELLSRLHALAEHFPHCDYLSRADSTAKRLEQMIAEDDTHPARTVDEIAALPPTEQAQEWIFRLRDQNGAQDGQPGWVDIFMTHEDSPAHHLLKLGDAAVPALIAALGDSRLTRSVGYGRDFFFSHEVITIGDAALTILERIADRQFPRSGLVQATKAEDGKTDPARIAVQKWWDERQSKGVLAELAEATARGDFSAERAGARLLADFPDAAATPILTGAAATKSDGERCAFIRLVGKLKDDRVPEFLLHEAREGPFLGARAEAASLLAKLGRTDGILPLIEQWRHSAPSSKPNDQAAREKLITVLALADSPDAIHALADGLLQRSPEARSRVLEALSPRRFARMESEGSQGGATRAALSAPTQEAIEELVVAEAEDTGAYLGIHGWINSRRIDNPRICDDAAALLAARWPDRYKFDINASYPVRERARLTCLNVWRQGHGQPPLPLPPERAPAAPGDELKIAEVVLAGDGMKLPESTLAVLRAARGQTIDAGLFETIKRTYMDACGGQAPDPHRGFFIDAFRDNATDGVTLVVAPARRYALAEHPKRDWRLHYFAMLAKREQLGAEGAYLFGNNYHEADPKRVEEIFNKIAALPVGSPFYFRMELAPELWADDVAF